MKENKGKGVASGTEGEEDIQVQNEVTPLAVQKLAVQARKRKSISSSIDLSDLPRRRGSKKQKPSKTSPPKVSKLPTMTVDLDDSTVNLVLIQTTPSSVHPENLPPPVAKTSHRTHPLVQTKRPPNLVLDEDYAWKTFKGFITDKEVKACYDMSMRDFECSAIHDLFKAMAKFYTASSQAKELGDEAKAAKAKSKELNNEVLLKKGEVIRLTEELSRLEGIEKKLRNEVEELKANSIEKETRINHLEVKCQEFTSSLEKAKKEAIATFMKSKEYTDHVDQYYAAGYEDFRFDAMEAYPEIDFDYFQIPTAAKSSTLQTSSKDVSIMDDASTEPAKDAAETSKDDPKSGGQCP